MPILRRIINKLKPKITFTEKREKLGFERNKTTKQIEPTTKKETKIKSIQKKVIVEKRISAKQQKMVAQIMNKHKSQIKALLELSTNTKTEYANRARGMYKVSKYGILLKLEGKLSELKKPFSSLTETEVQEAIAKLRKEYKEDQI